MLSIIVSGENFGTFRSTETESQNNRCFAHITHLGVSKVLEVIDRDVTLAAGYAVSADEEAALPGEGILTRSRALVRAVRVYIILLLLTLANLCFRSAPVPPDVYAFKIS